jgi:Mg-chelatase subunit ChlD
MKFVVKTKIALLILVVGVLSVGSFVLFHNKSQSSPTISDQGPTGNFSGLNNVVKADEATAPQRQAYPIEKWDTDIPYINPFGSQKNYKSVKLIPNQFQELRYVDKDNMETSRMTGGKAWQMQVEWKDKAADPMDDLLLYISELGGTAYPGGKENEWVVQAADDKGNGWWGVAARNSDGYLLTVYEEQKLHNGKTVTFKTADFKDAKFNFMTENSDHKYQSIKVSIADGEMQLVGKGSYLQGKYRRDLSYNKTLYAYKTKNYTFDDIPQDTSVPILWQVSWSKKSDPKEITVTLDEGDDITPVKDGERLGALKVRGITLGTTKVEMSPGVSMNHPELNLHGDQTPEGDTLFWLPSGYWNVVILPNDKKLDALSLDARMIPVSAGEMTVMDVKPLVSQSYGKTEVGDAGGGESQLKMTEVTEQGGQAKISFMLLDSQNSKFTPTPDNTEIVEGGQPAKIVNLERLQTPPSVVLVLDSSGSMSESMDNVIASARTFIQGLPDNASIQVIDFDSQVRILDGTTKAEVLGSLDEVKAEGSTVLYDATMKGLSLLKDKERPTLVVFTDGVDSSADKQGTGSKATMEEVEKAVQDSGIPLFTIGFGPDHDSTVLLELAGMSEGTYYSAQDTTALDNVFSSINDRLGNNFELTYERPKEEAPSDVPVISLTTDVSLSMDMDPSTKEGNYRIDKVKNLYHEFIKQIPDNSLMQLIGFSGDVDVDQVFTNRKPEMLQALGNLVVKGGTNILKSTEMTYESLKKVPSDKRVMVYLTDAALDVDKQNKESFEKILTGIKEDGIQVLWVGLGTGEGEEAFKWAAEKSGGKYVISEDPKILADAFQEVLSNAKQKPAEKVSVSLSINNDLGGGDVRQYTASQLADFSALQNSSEKVALNTITFQTGIKAPQYESETASLVYGSDIPSQDVKIYKRIPFNVKGKNKAMEWTAHEVYFMKRLKGVDAPGGKSYMAVDMELKNVHPEGAAYLIPDFASHFFVNMNDSGAYPASTATWLVEKPLAAPGKTDILIQPDETVRGVLIFLVPDEDTKQASVHFYDTANGHITLALVGTPKSEEVELTSLPTTVTGKLSDTFSMTMTASSDMDKIKDVEFRDKSSVFKVIDAELNSKVQADLKLTPGERFYLRMDTLSGPFMVPVNPATALLPYGFLRPVTMGPGSSNKVRLAFQTPNGLKDSPMDLYGDIHGGAMVLPLQGGETDTAESAHLYKGDGVTLTLNALAKVKSIQGFSRNYVVADVTIADAPNGSGTSGFRYGFKLVSGDGQSSQQPKELLPDPMTDDLLLGIHKDWAVFDGTSRRGILVFILPDDQAGKPWTLQSSLFGDLKQPVTEEAYNGSGLLVKEVLPPIDQKFDDNLAAALKVAISRQKALEAANSQGNTVKVNPNAGGEKEFVPTPSPTVYGLTQMKSVKTMSDFLTLMKGLKWLPSPDDFYRYRNAPESVLTQGWGNEGDLANLAGGLLAQLGYSPSLRMVKVTDKGRKALQELGGLDEVSVKNLPAWAYSDEQGNAKVFVVPFMKDLKDLGGLVYLPGGQEDRKMTPVESEIKVYFKVEPSGDKGLTSMAGDMASALAGGGGSAPALTEVRVLDKSLRLDQLGQGAADIYVSADKGLYTATLENQTLHIVGDQGVDPGKYKVEGVRIEVQLPKQHFVHETKFQDGEKITSVFHTLAINLPDMTTAAAESLQQAADREYQAAKNPDEHSTLAWYTRNILYRFIANQTEYENQLAKDLGVTVGRTEKERVLVVTVRRKDAESLLRTSFDLMQSANQVHRGTEEAAHSFNILSGLFASRLEGSVLPGDKADFVEVWKRSPDDTNLFFSLPSNRKDDLVYMKEHGFPDNVMQRAKDSSKVMIIPNKPTRIYGEDRWEWLEVDPKTYETIAVMDTGEHGSMAEYVMALVPEREDYLGFMVGAIVGVDTSIWSVSAFSLELTDYKEILKAAKAYTYGIAEVMENVLNLKDLIKLEYGIGPVKASFEGAEINGAFEKPELFFEKIEQSTGVKTKIAPDFIGFVKGFKGGAGYYFKQAEKGLEPDNQD